MRLTLSVLKARWPGSCVFAWIRLPFFVANRRQICKKDAPAVAATEAEPAVELKLSCLKSEFLIRKPGEQHHREVHKIVDAETSYVVNALGDQSRASETLCFSIASMKTVRVQ